MLNLFRRATQRQPTGQKDNPIAISYYSGPAAPARFFERSYDAFSREGYEKNAVVYRCISEIASAVSSIPLNVMQEQNDGGLKKVPMNHPLVQLLKSPNPMYSGARFVEDLMSYFLLSGNAYACKTGMPGRPPLELWLFRPDRMTVNIGLRGWPSAYVHKLNNKEILFPVDDQGRSQIMQHRSFSPLSEWYGLSPLAAAAQNVDINNSTNHWNKNLLDNGGRPSGALINTAKDASGMPIPLSVEQAARMSEEVERKLSGAGNAGRVLLIDGSFDFKEMQLTPKEMDYIQNKNTSARDICMVFRVPPQLVGIPGDSTYANYEQARLAFWENCVLSHIDSLVDDLNRWLALDYGPGIRITYDKNDLPALAERRKQQSDMANNSTFMTVNEKRELMGYEKLGNEGDVILVSSTMTPLGIAVAPPPPPPPAPNPTPLAPPAIGKKAYSEWLQTEVGMSKEAADREAENYAG